ncbi:MAG TPA: hypothetical protein VGG61_14900 [Gemmataceae bacterium]
MKSGFLCLLALGFIFLADTSLNAQPRGRGDADAAKYGWIFDLDEGIAQAAKSGKPLMVVFRCVP